ncbi:MAG: hypothetical protein WBP83_12710, partial [Nitrososphaeraceae archaeon]
SYAYLGSWPESLGNSPVLTDFKTFRIMKSPREETLKIESIIDFVNDGGDSKIILLSRNLSISFSDIEWGYPYLQQSSLCITM